MSFPINSSPYGNNMQFQASPMSGMPGKSQSRSPWWSALFGKPERNYQQSLLSPQQQPLLQNLVNASQNQGAGGAFGQSADYYRSLLSDDNSTANAMFSPEMRRFREGIIPDLAEQFSGYGGIGSSGFRNAAVSAGTDLAERLGAIRAQLRQQGAEGLAGIGRSGLSQYGENIHRPETFGYLGGTFEGAGKALGAVAAKAIPGLG